MVKILLRRVWLLNLDRHIIAVNRVIKLNLATLEITQKIPYASPTFSMNLRLGVSQDIRRNVRHRARICVSVIKVVNSSPSSRTALRPRRWNSISTRR